MTSVEQQRMREIPQKREMEPYDLLYDGIDLKKEIGSSGLRLIIPKVFLHGRQNKEEYSNKKRKQVEVALNKDGINFLLENPIIVCAISVKNQLLLTIIDGHHRSRYASLYGISDIPCIVCTISTIADVINRHKLETEKVSAQVLKMRLTEETLAAANSFSGSLPDIQQPKLIPFQNIRELKKKARSF